jgi:hypothetical protein
MAWSYAGRREETDRNDPRLALQYAAEVQMLLGEEQFIQQQLFNWWVP